jgi:lactoylglutathione lyase
MRTVTRIGHIALRARDMDAMLHFYRDTLGFDEMLRLNQDDGRLWLVYLRITDTQYLEIFPDGMGETPAREQMGVTHVCWEVDDMDAALAELEERGVPLTTPLRRGRTGNLQAWITDPDGNRVELMQMNPEGMTLRAVESLRQGDGPLTTA